MDDLLMAVGSTKLRWRGSTPSEAPAEGMDREMKLMQFAFNMGRGQSGAPEPSKCDHSSNSSPRSATLPFPALMNEPHVPTTEVDVDLNFIAKQVVAVCPQ